MANGTAGALGVRRVALAGPEPFDESCLVRMRDIHVSYQDVRALKGVNLAVRFGEVHALVGDHRAGKSTLVKVLSGALRKQSGQVLLEGRRVEGFTPALAIRSGIGIVYQDLNIIPTLNAVENIFAGRMPRTWFGKISSERMIRRAEELFSLLKVDIDIYAPLQNLSLGAQYMVELVRVLAQEPKLLILDEISGKLRPEEMELIYPILRDYRQQNRSVIYISHDMDEIFRLADRVTILRNGYSLGTERVKDLDRIKLLKMTYSFVLSREELEEDNIKLFYFKKYNEEIIRNLPIGVIILDEHNSIYLVNLAAMKILSIGSRQAVKKLSIRELLSRKGVGRMGEIAGAIDSREPHTWEEVDLGRERFGRVSIYPFQDEDYHFLGTIILLEDTSRDHFFKEYLLRTQKITSIAELAAGVAHEINNPLGIIQNHLELIKLSNQRELSAESIGKIEKEIARIVDTVGNLLSFSRLNEPPTEQVELVSALEDVVALLRHKLREKNITLSPQVSHEQMWLVGDENRLKQVMLNLLLNSIEAVEVGGQIRVELRSFDRKGVVELAVTDDGCGIPPEIMKSIFDPFYSTKSGKGNTGLGLAICQHIVELHQGWISCKSTPGKRTTFKVRFPLSGTRQEQQVRLVSP